MRPGQVQCGLGFPDSCRELPQIEAASYNPTHGRRVHQSQKYHKVEGLPNLSLDTEPNGLVLTFNPLHCSELGGKVRF